MSEQKKAGQIRLSTDRELGTLVRGLDDNTLVTILKQGDQFVIDPASIREVNRSGRWILLSRWIVGGGLALVGYYALLSDQFSDYVPKLQVLVPITAEAAKTVYADISAAFSSATPPSAAHVSSEPAKFVVAQLDTFAPPKNEPPGDVLLAGYRYVALSNVAPMHSTGAFLRISGSANF